MSQGFVNSNNLPLPLSVINGGTGVSTSTGTGAVVLNNTPSLITPRITSGLLDPNGNLILVLAAQVSPVNFLAVANAATTNAVQMAVDGSDANIILTISGKGTGRVQIKGTGNANSVSNGYVGEFVTNQLPFASATPLVSITPKNVTSISLTAGDWDVWGSAFIALSGGSNMQAWVSATSATVPDSSLLNSVAISGLNGGGVSAHMQRFLLGGTTTIYLSVNAAFTTSGNASGAIYARRRS